jgi:hypothetical protein
VHLKYISITVQQDANIYSLFVSLNCSTYFGWYLHPSSGAHTTVSTASGTSQTVAVVCAPDDWWRYHPKHVEQFTDTNKVCIKLQLVGQLLIHEKFNVTCGRAAKLPAVLSL